MIGFESDILEKAQLSTSKGTARFSILSNTWLLANDSVFILRFTQHPNCFLIKVERSVFCGFEKS